LRYDLSMKRLLLILAACGGDSGGGGGGGGGTQPREPSCEVAGAALVKLVADPDNKLASTDPDEKAGNTRAIEAWTGSFSRACKRESWPTGAIECFSKGTAKAELERCNTTLDAKQRESITRVLALAASELRAGPLDVPTTKGGKKTYRIGKDDQRLDVTLDVPREWRDQSGEDRVVLNTMKGSWIKVSLTCHGACGDGETLVKNIATVAKERIAFTMSDSFQPTLESVWDEEVTERARQEYHYTFHGNAKDKTKDWGVKYVTVDRIVGNRILHCTVELVSKDFDQLAAVGSTCTKLAVAEAK
jgi:hypothetical protein